MPGWRDCSWMQGIQIRGDSLEGSGGPYLTTQRRAEGSWGRRHAGLSKGGSHLHGGLSSISELGPLSKRKTLSSPQRPWSQRQQGGRLCTASTLSSRLFFTFPSFNGFQLELAWDSSTGSIKTQKAPTPTPPELLTQWVGRPSYVTGPDTTLWDPQPMFILHRPKVGGPACL